MNMGLGRLECVRRVVLGAVLRLGWRGSFLALPVCLPACFCEPVRWLYPVACAHHGAVARDVASGCESVGVGRTSHRWRNAGAILRSFMATSAHLCPTSVGRPPIYWHRSRTTVICWCELRFGSQGRHVCLARVGQQMLYTHSVIIIIDVAEIHYRHPCGKHHSS